MRQHVVPRGRLQRALHDWLSRFCADPDAPHAEILRAAFELMAAHMPCMANRRAS